MNTPTRFNLSKQVDGSNFDETATPSLPDVFEDTEPDAFMRIKAFCDSGDARSTLGIYRALPNRKEQYLCKLGSDEFDPELIKGRFGGGEFIIKAYDENSRIRLNQRLAIEGEPIIEVSPKNTQVALSTPYPPQAFDMSSFMAAMAENNRQMLSGLAQLVSPQQSHSRTDMLNEMLTMKELFSQGHAPQSADPVSMLLKGLELAQTLVPKVGGETSGMDVLLESIKSFAPAITTVISQGNAQQARRPLQAPLKAASAQPALNAPENIIPTTEGDTDMMFKYYVGLLVNFAAQGKDPQLYADMIADNLPEDKLLEIAKNPNIIEDLAKIHPGVLEHRAWFDAVVSEIKIILDLTKPGTSANVTESESESESLNLSNEDHTDGNAVT